MGNSYCVRLHPAYQHSNFGSSFRQPLNVIIITTIAKLVAAYSEYLGFAVTFVFISS